MISYIYTFLFYQYVKSRYTKFFSRHLK